MNRQVYLSSAIVSRLFSTGRCSVHVGRSCLLAVERDKSLRTFSRRSRRYGSKSSAGNPRLVCRERSGPVSLSQVGGLRARRSWEPGVSSEHPPRHYRRTAWKKVGVNFTHTSFPTPLFPLSSARRALRPRPSSARPVKQKERGCAANENEAVGVGDLAGGGRLPSFGEGRGAGTRVGSGCVRGEGSALACNRVPVVLKGR